MKPKKTFKCAFCLAFEGWDKSRLLDLKKGKYSLFIISQSGQSDALSFEVK